MAATKPILVFVHGAWHSPECWSRVTPILEAEGYKCIAIDLPTTYGDPSVSLGDDVKVTRDAIEAETTEGRNVVVIVHSYGGLVGQSAIKGLARPKEGVVSERAAGYIIGLVVIASGYIQTGKSFVDAMGGEYPPQWKIEDNGLVGLAVSPKEFFYHDLSDEEANVWISKLRPHTLKSLIEGQDTYAGWMDVPVWHLLTIQDVGLPIELQRMIVKIGKDAGADITAREIDTSHSPFLSKPKETADFILEAAKSIAAK
jgi:pimeloyl-ACP methyl ester carboxylesterase